MSFLSDGATIVLHPRPRQSDPKEYDVVVYSDGQVRSKRIRVAGLLYLEAGHELEEELAYLVGRMVREMEKDSR